MKKNTTASAWSPRYQAYAKASNLTPEEMMAHDQEALPGGVMVGYILWITEKLSSFRERSPEAFSFGSLRKENEFLIYLGA